VLDLPSLNNKLCISICIPTLVGRVFWFTPRCCSKSIKALLEIGYYIVDMLSAHRDSNQILRNARRNFLFVRQLLMCGTPGVDGKRLQISDVCQVGTGSKSQFYLDWEILQNLHHLETINDFCSCFPSTFNTETENTTESSRHVLLGQFMRLVTFKSQIAHPRDMRVLLQPLR